MERQKAEVMRVRRYRRAYIGPVMVIAIGAVLMWLAVPLLISEVYLSGAARTLQDIRNPKSGISEARLLAGASELDVAISWKPRSRRLRVYQAELMLARYERFYSRMGVNSGEGRALLEQAKRQLMAALDTGPGDANSWYLLSEVAVRLDENSRSVFDYLRLSHLMGQREGWVASRRLGFSLRNWTLLSAQGKRDALKDLSLLWDEQPYHKYLARMFLGTNSTGRAVLYRSISKRGLAARETFVNSLRIEGRRGQAPLLWDVVGMRCGVSNNCGESK